VHFIGVHVFEDAVRQWLGALVTKGQGVDWMKVYKFSVREVRTELRLKM
jgi:hypothetical protein